MKDILLCIHPIKPHCLQSYVPIYYSDSVSLPLFWNKIYQLQTFDLLVLINLATLISHLFCLFICLALLEAARKANFQDVLSRISAGFSSNR
jgi:hypothetical protein